MDDRAATETLGMVLLLAIVILLATTIGLSLLTQTSAIQDGTERSYLNIEPDLNTSALTLIHAGGPSFQTSNLTLILQNDTGRQRYDSGDFTVSGPDDVFETGDRLTVSHSFTGYVDIALYSSETDERLYRAVRSTNPSSDISTPPTDGSTGPTAQIAALSQVAEGFNITLDGSGSTDPDGSVDSYEWTIVSGPGTIVEDDTATPTAEYQSPSDVSGDQNVTVELTVTDDDGNTDTETFEITVVDTDTAEAPEDSSGDGSAFNDTNGNGVYDEGEEVVSKDDLEDGYNDPDTDLVIYPVVGEIRTSGNNNPVDITANTITAGSNFRASGGTINLVADGDIRIDDVTLESNGNGGITITSREGRIFANRTTMLATSGNAPIDFNSNGDIYLESADLDGGSYSADLGTSSATLYVDQMTIDGTLVYDPDDITVDPSGADGDTVSSN